MESEQEQEVMYPDEIFPPRIELKSMPFSFSDLFNKWNILYYLNLFFKYFSTYSVNIIISLIIWSL